MTQLPKIQETFEHTVLYWLLSPHSNEQQVELNHILLNEGKLLDKNRALLNFLNNFLSDELININDQPFLLNSQYIAEINVRIQQKNILTINKYQSKAYLTKVAALIGLSKLDSEKLICDMVFKAMVEVKIDRPNDIVYFKKKEDYNQTLNNWGSDVYKVFNLLEDTCNLIDREYTIIENK